MRAMRPFGVAFLLLLAAARFAAADDPWDLVLGNPANDDNSNTTNELVNGSAQTHDLQDHAGGSVIDQDWFRVYEQPFSSYDVVVDGITPETGGVSLDRVNSTGTVLQQSVGLSSYAAARTLRLRNASATESGQFLRVESTACGTFGACTADARYRIQLNESTCLIPRFNNNGTQVTILVVQNGSVEGVSASARFWDATGTLLATQTFVLAPKGALVLNTSGLVPGQSGSITIDHDGAYGSLSGKAVAVEPATGFTFDTAMTSRVH
jgi:hypothetical protein